MRIISEWNKFEVDASAERGEREKSIFHEIINRISVKQSVIYTRSVEREVFMQKTGSEIWREFEEFQEKSSKIDLKKFFFVKYQQFFNLNSMFNNQQWTKPKMEKTSGTSALDLARLSIVLRISSFFFIFLNNFVDFILF